MTPTNLIWAIKSSPPAQNVTTEQNFRPSHSFTLPETHTIHPIRSLKPFTYKINLKKSNYVTRRGKDFCNSRQLLCCKCLEIKRTHALQLQHSDWSFETLLLQEKDDGLAGSFPPAGRETQVTPSTGKYSKKQKLPSNNSCQFEKKSFLAISLATGMWERHISESSETENEANKANIQKTT